MPDLPNALIPGWRSADLVREWAARNGFGAPSAMTDRALRALSRQHGGKPSGLYLWEAAGHEVYVGISAGSVTTRLRAHVRERGELNIQQFWYRPSEAATTDLRVVEREMIHRAVRDGLACVNNEHSAWTTGPSTLDELLAVPAQRDWFRNPWAANSADRIRRHPPTDAESARCRARFATFRAQPYADAVETALGEYLARCVPLPHRTESTYWTMSCLPSTSRTALEHRVTAVCMGYLELLWIHAAGPDIRVYLGTDYQLLPARRTIWRLQRMGVTMRGNVHTAGGAAEEVLEFASIDTFLQALRVQPAIARAAARFALDRMRKGRVSGRYADAHNFLLAERAFDRMPVARRAIRVG